MVDVNLTPPSSLATTTFVHTEQGLDACTATFPKVDTQAANHMASTSGYSVDLNNFYKPFKNSILAMSEDELTALRSIAFVQQELHESQVRLATWRRRQTFLEAEVAAVMCLAEDKARAKASKQNFYNSQQFSLTLINCSHFNGSQS